MHKDHCAKLTAAYFITEPSEETRLHSKLT
jgi:hypothetical protein